MYVLSQLLYTYLPVLNIIINFVLVVSIPVTQEPIPVTGGKNSLNSVQLNYCVIIIEKSRQS